jgi:hypothetical protein
MGGFRFTPEKLSRKAVSESLYLNLRRTPVNPAAEALVSEIHRRVILIEDHAKTRTRARRADADRQLRAAIGAIVGNLLLAWAETPPRAVSRSLFANTFTGEDIGYPAFADAMRWMKKEHLLHRRKGGRLPDGSKGAASRFWPTQGLLTLAASYGIDTATVATDFGWRKSTSQKVPKVREPIVLWEITAHPNAGRGRKLRIDQHDLVAASLQAEVERLNAFAAQHDVTGCRPPRWQRHFRGDWRLYGRLHAVGDGNYQSMPADRRVNDIRINGEPVVEIDISASHLSIMHALMSLPLPESDPYAIPGPNRKVVKVWINATLGKGSPVRKWPKKRLAKMPELAALDPLKVMAAVLKQYPWLAEPWRLASEFEAVANPKRVLPHMLMGIESDIMLAVVQALNAQGILGMPIHDGILVPAPAADLACDLILSISRRESGIELKVKTYPILVHRPQLQPKGT